MHFNMNDLTTWQVLARRSQLEKMESTAAELERRRREVRIQKLHASEPLRSYTVSREGILCIS
jgi:hypothetical protein